jgi:REP element-mobilizing transposase RayT
MPHTYVSDLVHCAFSTKERRRLIHAETQPELWAFIGGVARKSGFKTLIVRGTEDHVHILLSLPATRTARQGGATAERLIVSMDERDTYQRILLARGLWRVHAWSFAKATHD